MKKVFRSIQTLFPFLHDLRFYVKMKVISITHKPHEEDFEALAYFTPEISEVFIDIGSNRGEAISSMLACMKTKNNIIGFEPNSIVFSKLEKQFANNPRVKVNNIGLGNIDKDLNLYIPYYRKWMFDGLSSFKYEEASEWLVHRLWRFNVKNLSVKTTKCKVRRLDDFILNPYFIKIDVQGFELEALIGAEKTLRSYKPILLIESISEEVKLFLNDFGYRYYCYCNGKLELGDGKLNTFCITKEKESIIQLQPKS